MKKAILKFEFGEPTAEFKPYFDMLSYQKTIKATRMEKLFSKFWDSKR